MQGRHICAVGILAEHCGKINQTEALLTPPTLPLEVAVGLCRGEADAGGFDPIGHCLSPKDEGHKILSYLVLLKYDSVFCFLS